MFEDIYQKKNCQGSTDKNIMIATIKKHVYKYLSEKSLISNTEFSNLVLPFLDLLSQI